jgi:hypothetical protein
LVVGLVVVEVDVVEVEVVLVDVEVVLVEVVARVVVVLALVVVELDEVVEVSVAGTVVPGLVPSSSDVARKKIRMPPRTTSTNSTMTAMPSGDDQGDLVGGGSGATAGGTSAA